MSLSINTNVSSLNAQRHAGNVSGGLARSIQRLSSGIRINSAADDAAGLAISERMTAGVRGMNQARRNISDAGSLLQVADGAMAQVSDNLQRLRELAVQAGNAGYGTSDRESLQQEARQILAQISKVAGQTAFNGEAVFSQDTTSIGGDARKRGVIDALKTGWLTQAENLVRQYYGIEADGANITINLEGGDGPSNVLASVSGTFGGASGMFNNISLNLDMDDFGSADAQLDRIIAHEMAHAVMSRSTGIVSHPQWFVEGTAELIQGADSRLRGAIMGGGSQAVVDTLSSGFSYESAYLGARYLHAKLNEMGVEGGMKGIMVYLARNEPATLSAALNAVTGGVYADVGAFEADFSANGAAFADNMDLTNADTGAIGGFDADEGPVRNGAAVVPDGGERDPDDPLAGFTEIFPELGGYTASRQVRVQLGAGSGDYITVDFSAMNAAALGLADLSLEKSAVAIMHIDQALAFVSKQRTVVGASSSRLDAAATNLAIGAENLSAARARILDTDYAVETGALTRSQILQQAATAMIAQANSQPNQVLQLLR